MSDFNNHESKLRRRAKICAYYIASALGIGIAIGIMLTPESFGTWFCNLHDIIRVGIASVIFAVSAILFSFMAELVT